MVLGHWWVGGGGNILLAQDFINYNGYSVDTW